MMKNEPDFEPSGCGPASELPALLLNDPDLKPADVKDFIRVGVQQWSRIAAWTWCDFLAFSGTKNESDEKNLKEFLRIALKEQPRCCNAFTAYEQEQVKFDADQWSKVIQCLLVGENKKAQEFVPDDPRFTDIKKRESLSVTLSHYIEKIGETKEGNGNVTKGPQLVTTDPKYRKLVDKLYLRVINNSFQGKLVAYYGKETSKIMYINYLAHPQRPELGARTVTEKELYDWASNASKYNDFYLPPSAYIPIANC